MKIGFGAGKKKKKVAAKKGGKMKGGKKGAASGGDDMMTDAASAAQHAQHGAGQQERDDAMAPLSDEGEGVGAGLASAKEKQRRRMELKQSLKVKVAGLKAHRCSWEGARASQRQQPTRALEVSMAGGGGGCMPVAARPLDLLCGVLTCWPLPRAATPRRILPRRFPRQEKADQAFGE
jgi:hypothetical protein